MSESVILEVKPEVKPRKKHVDVTNEIIFFKNPAKKRLLKHHIKLVKYISHIKKDVTNEDEYFLKILDSMDKLVEGICPLITFGEVFYSYSLKLKETNEILYENIEVSFFDNIDNNFSAFTECFTFVIEDLTPEEAELSEVDIKKK